MQYLRESRYWLFVASLLCLGVASSRAALADEAVIEQVQKIFAAIDGDGSKKSSSEEAFHRLEQLKPGSKESAAVHYAYLLGLMQLHKLSAADAVAAEMVQRHADDVDARLMRMRILLRGKKFADVFAELEKTGKLMAESTKEVPLSSTTENRCRTLGLIFGYLEGPAKPLVKTTLGAGVKQHLIASFSSDAVHLLNEQYDQVLDEQKQIVERGEEALKEMQAKHREASEEMAKRKAKLEADKKKSEEQKQAAKDRLTKQWDDTKGDYDRLAATFANLNSSLAVLQNQRAELVRQIQSMRPKKPATDSNGKVSSNDQRNYDEEMRSFERNAMQYQNQVNQLDQRVLAGNLTLQQTYNQGYIAQGNLARLQQEGERLGLEFEMKDKTFEQKESQLERAEAAKKKPPKAPSKQIEQAFTSYDDFNYAMEKQRLLDSLQTTNN